VFQTVQWCASDVSFQISMLLVQGKVKVLMSASHGRTGSPGSLALTRWAGWSPVEVGGRHVKC